MDPLTWAAVIQGGSAVLGKVLDSPGGGPSRADSSLFAPGTFSFDNSGFAVDFGPGNASATGSTAAPSWTWVAIAGMGLFGVIVWLKRKP